MRTRFSWGDSPWSIGVFFPPFHSGWGEFRKPHLFQPVVPQCDLSGIYLTPLFKIRKDTIPLENGGIQLLRWQIPDLCHS